MHIPARGLRSSDVAACTRAAPRAQGGCYNPKNPPNTSDPCYDSSYCVYSHLFKFINEAATAAKQHSQVPILSAFADVDQVLDKIQRAGHLVPALDIWAVQLYRGYSFGSWFKKANNASKSATNHKAFLITEYGVDAYHDACGHDVKKTPCFNQLGDASGSHEDEGTQALWNRNLTKEIAWHSSAQDLCVETSSEYQEAFNLTGDDGYTNDTCVVAGGFVYSWVDEYWKGSFVAAECRPNFWEPAFTLDKCEYKAHVTCANWNASLHDLCGQPLHSSPDHYQNEEWFGMTTPTKCADSMDRCAAARRGAGPRRETHPRAGSLAHRRRLCRAPIARARTPLCARPPGARSLRLRKVYWALREEWQGDTQNGSGSIKSPSCNQITRCPADCSGRGKCETDHKICGPADLKPNSGAPCCRCNIGWAGERCDMLDARTKMAVGAGFSLLTLVGLMLLAQGALPRGSSPTPCGARRAVSVACAPCKRDPRAHSPRPIRASRGMRCTHPVRLRRAARRPLPAQDVSHTRVRWRRHRTEPAVGAQASWRRPGLTVWVSQRSSEVKVSSDMSMCLWRMCSLVSAPCCILIPHRDHHLLLPYGISLYNTTSCQHIIIYQ